MIRVSTRSNTDEGDSGAQGDEPLLRITPTAGTLRSEKELSPWDRMPDPLLQENDTESAARTNVSHDVKVKSVLFR
jgi:hypothetical protein